MFNFALDVRGDRDRGLAGIGETGIGGWQGGWLNLFGCSNLYCLEAHGIFWKQLDLRELSI